jgi:hypothetical protein
MGNSGKNDDVAVMGQIEIVCGPIELQCLCKGRVKILGELPAQQVCILCSRLLIDRGHFTRDVININTQANSNLRYPADHGNPGGDEWFTKPSGKPARYFCRGCGDHFEAGPPVTISPCCDTPNPVRR